MSGIVGILNLDGAPVDRELLERMTAFQAFRGPDRQDLWIDGPIGFGHTLARTTDESAHERQPCSLDGRLWITADARVDAREDLRGRLRDHTSADLEAATDPELVLHAYDAWGEECFQHLLGDFSFALWDASRRRLVCAVDHFGVKPFYYARVGNAFVFSNTLDCVRLHPLVRDELNEVAIGDFLLFGYYQDRDITVYADIPRIPPAHYLVVEKGEVRRTRYWTLPEVPELRLNREEEYVERFQELLDKAVSDRLRTSRVGVFMSGGLDSPLVTATARSLLPKQRESFEISAYTAVFDSLIPDEERHYSGIVGQSLGVPVHYRAIDELNFYDWHERWGCSTPEPVHEPWWSEWLALCRMVLMGSRLAVSGWDGDALLRGSPTLHWWQRIRDGELGCLIHDVMWYVATQRALPPIGFRARLRNLAGRVPKPSLPSWVDRGFVERASLADRWAEFVNPEETHNARDSSRANCSSPQLGALWNRHDPSWTHCALEVRHPLMDIRIVNFALALPTVPWCVGKELFRRSLHDLPAEVARRPKTPLAADPLSAKMSKLEGLTPEWSRPESKLLSFVNVTDLRPEAIVGDTDALWRSLRPASLNYWLRFQERPLRARSEPLVGEPGRRRTSCAQSWRQGDASSVG